jgi:predicted AAA+ superfamily ATPase
MSNEIKINAEKNILHGNTVLADKAKKKELVKMANNALISSFCVLERVPSHDDTISSLVYMALEGLGAIYPVVFFGNKEKEDITGRYLAIPGIYNALLYEYNDILDRLGSKYKVALGISEDNKGKILENAVRANIQKSLHLKNTFCYRDEEEREVDIVFYDNKRNVYAFEVKHRSTISQRDTRWLRSAEVLDVISYGKYKPVTAVLYLGETNLANRYVNVEDFLCDIPKYLRLLNN